jgi:hypothetical protein
MLAIEGMSVTDAVVDDSGSLILSRHDGTTIDAGVVVGPKGDKGDNSLPGSVSVAPGTVVVRDSEGRSKSASPTAGDDVATKAYVDKNFGLPDPMVSYFVGQISVSATSAGTQLPSLTPITVTTPRPMWVDLRLSALGLATTGEVRASIILAGVTTSSWPMYSNGNILYLAGVVSAGLSVHMSMSQAYKLNAGTTTVKVEAYLGNTASPNFINHPKLEVVPLRWAD